MVLICKNLNSLHPHILCAKFGRNWPSVYGEDFFLFCQYFFANSLLSPLRKGLGHSLGEKPRPPKNLNSLSPKMLCAESGRNWPSAGSGEDDF